MPLANPRLNSNPAFLTPGGIVTTFSITFQSVSVCTNSVVAFGISFLRFQCSSHQPRVRTAPRYLPNAGLQLRLRVRVRTENFSFFHSGFKGSAAKVGLSQFVEVADSSSTKRRPPSDLMLCFTPGGSPPSNFKPLGWPWAFDVSKSIARMVWPGLEMAASPWEFI